MGNMRPKLETLAYPMLQILLVIPILLTSQDLVKLQLPQDSRGGVRVRVEEHLIG